MAGFFIRLAISALGLWVASRLVPGMDIRDNATLLWAALWLGLVNAVVRPLAILLTLPLTILTLGIFLLFVNAAMLGLVASLLDGFSLSGVMAAVLGSLVVSFTGWAASSFIGPSGRVEMMVVRR